MVSASVRIVLQARTSSRRLPGKVLMPVGGMPLVTLSARRVMRDGHQLVVATSDTVADDFLTETLQYSGIQVRRGPLEDVLKRFVFATNDLRETDTCVRLTADNPFPDGDLVEKLISKFNETEMPYMSTADIFPFRLPLGLSAEIFSVGVLREADKFASESSYREHVTTYMRKILGERLMEMPKTEMNNNVGLRCTVDTLEDYLKIAGFFLTVPDPVGQNWYQLLSEFRTYAGREGG